MPMKTKIEKESNRKKKQLLKLLRRLLCGGNFTLVSLIKKEKLFILNLKMLQKKLMSSKKHSTTIYCKLGTAKGTALISTKEEMIKLVS